MFLIKKWNKFQILVPSDFYTVVIIDAEVCSSLCYMKGFNSSQLLLTLLGLCIGDYFIHYRDAALNDAKQQIRSFERKLDSSIARHQLDKESWEVNLHNVEDTWRCNTFILPN